MWLVGVGLFLAGLVVGTGGMQLIRASELKTQSGHISQGQRPCHERRGWGHELLGQGPSGFTTEFM